MPCDRKLKPRQTISERAKEIREATERLTKAIMAGRVKFKVGPTGAPLFLGWDETSRDGIDDVCAYRRIMAQGNAALKMAIAAAEQLAGRPVSKAAVTAGHHSHDGGQTWHTHKG